MSTRRKPLESIQLDLSKSPHAGLWLDKFITEQDKSRKEVRSSFVREVARIQPSDSYAKFFKRWKENLTSYLSGDCVVRLGVAKAQGRLVIGTGNEAVLETAITLHRTYGVPYIPGSALKGLAANFARNYCGAEWRKNSDAYKIVFGETDESGCLTFFDALPDPDGNSRLLYADVLTVHHREYYQASSPVPPPTDWDDPNPVPFLSATGKYLVALAAPTGGAAWLEIAFKILGEALREIGIGAKTSSGYGRMRVLSA